MSIRIALFGQAPVALGCLDGLLERGHEIAGVFAPPDGARPDALAERGRELGVPTFQRRYFQRRDGTPIPAALDLYATLRADLNVLASLTSFLPPAIADAPRLGSVCFHPSLLPAYRGGNALQWQIIDGVRETGVSIFVPDRGVDTGPIVVQRAGVRVEPLDTAGSLFFRKLAPLGVEALLESVDQIAAGSAVPKAQDESLATHQGLVDAAAAAVDLEQPGEKLDRQIRGCDPAPGALLRWQGEALRVFDVRFEPGAVGAAAGEVLELGEREIAVALLGGVLWVGRVRAGGPKEAASQFAARVGMRPGSRLESGVVSGG